MPFRDEDWTDDKRDRHIGGAYPLSRTNWHLRRPPTLRRCEFSGKLILPFAKAYRQQIFWGLANAETHTELEEKWLTPASYLFKKLNNTL